MTPASVETAPLRLSLCMIVKNESHNLHRCLSSVCAWVDEMIIVDTGSSDETVAIAQQYGATVDFFAWRDDFGAARNYSISKASGNWVLILDADEELTGDAAAFRSQIESSRDILAFAIDRVDLVPSQYASNMVGGFHVRLFQNIPGFQYRGRYHEQLVYEGDRPKQYAQLTGAQILHHGNSDEDLVREKTLSRNIPILEQIRCEEGLSFWLLDCLARNYLSVGQDDAANHCYAEAMDRLLPHLLTGDKPADSYWLITMMLTLAEGAVDRQDFETAFLLCQRGLEWFPNALPMNYFAGKVLLNAGFALGAVPYFETCLRLSQTDQFYSVEPFDRGLLHVDPACALGQAHLELQNWEKAEQAFELALAAAPDCELAQQELKALRQRPRS
ncbi:MAG: glycosyltransferase [Synechococcales bacterium]|nr:glycosyltransferase [Synechococcales bacterium]